MVSRRTLPVLIGIVFLSGMFLLGQDTWGPPGPSPSSNLPHTGIAKCYDSTQEIGCPSPGEPFYGQDAQYIINPMSFADNGNGTVTDNVTGLMWQKCTAGLSGPTCSAGTAHYMTWFGAIAYCSGYTLAGYSDWRLPDNHDLQSIMDYSQSSPIVDGNVFPGTRSSWYWSSSTRNEQVWGVNFGVGFFERGDPYFTHHVRCVRGEQTPRSFEANGDGTVMDRATGLFWEQQDDAETRSWDAALAYCENLVLPAGGYSDWRLPNIKELGSIVDYTRFPSIDPVFPIAIGSWSYWSSSTHALNSDMAWSIEFGWSQARPGIKAGQVVVRCVR